MEETYTLTCKFKDTENKTRSIEINNPTEDLSDDKILVAPWPALIAFDDQHPGQRYDVGSWGYECIGRAKLNFIIQQIIHKRLFKLKS